MRGDLECRLKHSRLDSNPKKFKTEFEHDRRQRVLNKLKCVPKIERARKIERWENNSARQFIKIDPFFNKGIRKTRMKEDITETFSITNL